MSAFWHPFGNPAIAERDRLVLAGGDGATVVDIEGNQYFDATAALWYCAVGHGRTEIADAIASQARELASYSCFGTYATKVTLTLADRIAQSVPIVDPMVFLTSGGSDGVETAAKMVRRHFVLAGRPEKTTIVARAGSYHGTHAYGTSLGGIPGNHHGWGELVPDVAHVPPFDLEALEKTIGSLGPERVGGFFVEPVIGAGGVYPPPDDYLRGVGAICAKYDIIMVCDEVVTGVGRTGVWSASERYGIEPDLMILAKGLTSGYQPLGAVVASPKVLAPFLAEGGDTFKHGYTYSGHATACAAATANLDLIEREGLVGRAAELGDRLPALLGGLESIDGIEEVRAVGLAAAVQFDLDRLAERRQDPAEIVLGCRRRGVLTRLLASGALHFSPPFVSTEAQIEDFAQSVADAVADVPVPR
jgi:adenosylmethionine-8-amino-7-oxononanoate aminotransferase